MRNPKIAPQPTKPKQNLAFMGCFWPQTGLSAVVRPLCTSMYTSGRSSLMHRFGSQMQALGKSRVQPVEIGQSVGGNEQVLCTFWEHPKMLVGVKTTSSTQQSPALSATFPQAKKQIITLLQGLFSPQSTTPINTITININ